MKHFDLESIFSKINWKFASNCRWCTINYFILPFAIIAGILSETTFYGWIAGMIVWGTILGLHYSGLLDDDESVDKAYVFTKSSLRNADKDSE